MVVTVLSSDLAPLAYVFRKSIARCRRPVRLRCLLWWLTAACSYYYNHNYAAACATIMDPSMMDRLAASAAESTWGETPPVHPRVSQDMEEVETVEHPPNDQNTNKRVKLEVHYEDHSSPCSNGDDFGRVSAVTPSSSSSSSSTRVASEFRQNPLSCPKKIAALLLREAGYTASDQTTPTTTTKKRIDYVSFDDYFMATAILSSHRSKDPVNATGVCIVDSSSNRIIGTGYNGFPVGCCDDVLPWNVETANSPPSTSWLHSRSPYMVTAEVNAILNKVTADCTGARLYTQQFPNADSAKVIIQSGIAEVVYMDNTNDNDTASTDQLNSVNESSSIRASRILLTMAGVRMRRYQPTHETVVLDFTKALDATDDNHSSCCSTAEVKTESSTVLTNNADNKVVLEHRDLLMKEAKYDPLAAGSTKRPDALSWDDYFLSMAFLAAQRSKDPNTQVGACIVDANQRIVGLGYNGFPRGCSDDDLPWARHSDQGDLHTKYMYVCHAEVNAILNKGSADVRGATLYVALFPCNECAKVIVQAGIRQVVYMSDRYHDTDACRASRILLHMAGVKLRKHIPSVRSICIQLAKPTSKCG